MCAVDTKLKVPKFGHRSAQEKLVRACGVHWSMVGGHPSIPATAVFDLPLALLNDEYTFCFWLALTLEGGAACFGG